MAAPINTYNSSTDLSLSQVPQVEDPELYTALLDIHNALSILITSSDDGNAEFLDYLNKKRNVTTITENYSVAITDGLIRIDASGSSLIVTLPLAANYSGYEFAIKVIAQAVGNTVLVIGSGSDTVDGDAGGVYLDYLDCAQVKSAGTANNWEII